MELILNGESSRSSSSGTTLCQVYQAQVHYNASLMIFVFIQKSWLDHSGQGSPWNLPRNSFYITDKWSLSLHLRSLGRGNSSFSEAAHANYGQLLFLENISLYQIKLFSGAEQNKFRIFHKMALKVLEDHYYVLPTFFLLQISF